MALREQIKNLEGCGMGRPHVLIVGAGGVFGSRLALMLAARRTYRLSLGGRHPERMERLAAEVQRCDPEGGHVAIALDRDQVTAAALRALGASIVVDCAGPFQISGTNLLRAAIEAGCNYVDLADSRAALAQVDTFDADARSSGVAVIAGASSTPALSNAAIAQMVAGWRAIDTIDCAIVPGNQTPKGRSVVAGILSWVGQPVRVFREGEWQRGHGWSGGRFVTVTGLRARRAQLAEVPDLDELPARWRPRVRAGFNAGMELDVLNRLIALAALPVRWRLIPSARVFTGLGHLIANSLHRFGTSSGGMVVEVTGVDGEGRNAEARWELAARAGSGPLVPLGPAAAIVARLASGTNVPPGARSAAGLVSLAEIAQWYEGHAITMSTAAVAVEPALFRRLLAEAFDRLPEATRRLHRGRPAIVADGEAEVEASGSAMGRLLARLLSMPVRSGRVPLRVVIEQREGREYWSRRFGNETMRTQMRAMDGLIVERFGPFSMRMRLEAHEDGIDMRLVGGACLGVPIPRWLLPRVTAEERVDERGRHLFRVDISLPLLGRLVAYAGHLDV